MQLLASKPVRSIVSRLPRGGPRLAKLFSPNRGRETFELTGDLAGTRITVDTCDVFESQMAFGVYQRPIIEVLKRLAQPGDTVLVAGANIGYIPLVLANYGCKVVAFEADPRNARACQHNLSLNPALPINFLAEGLSNENTNLKMWQSSVGTHSSFGAQHHSGAYVTVPARKGDDALASIGITRLDGMVLDVEGWECHALEGLHDTLSTHLPRWAIIESADWALKVAGKTPDDLRKMIEQLGWRISANLAGDLICLSD